METLISNIFFNNWQQKVVAVITAVVVWFFVSHSIMETKIIPSVPIRVVNIPPEYTILGLMPNGILQKRITLTVTGTKDVVERLEPGDLEIVIDASIIDHSDWILQITKNNLVSLDPSIDLSQHINYLVHSEYVIKIRRMITEEIPVTMLAPRGEAPPGYEFLDIWPQNLMQTYSGAEEEIHLIKNNGLELQFDLSRISKADLDSLATSSNSGKDEVTFFVPENWKRILIPCRTNVIEELNDMEASELQIDFLRKQVFPIGKEIPIRVYYPLEYIKNLNPDTFPLSVNDQIKKKEGVMIFTPQLFVHDVTQEFLNTIRDHLEIVITASPTNKRELLEWSVEVVNPHDLEDKYIAAIFKNYPKTKDAQPQTIRRREGLFRKRFQEYMLKLQLYISPEQPLSLEAFLDEKQITVRSPTP